MQKVSAYKRKAGKVKAHKRRVKGGGTIMVKASTRSAATIKAHKAREKGKARKKRNSVGRVVYA